MHDGQVAVNGDDRQMQRGGCATEDFGANVELKGKTCFRNLALNAAKTHNSFCLATSENVRRSLFVKQFSAPQR